MALLNVVIVVVFMVIFIGTTLIAPTSSSSSSSSFTPPPSPPNVTLYSDPYAIQFYNVSSFVVPALFSNVSIWCDNEANYMRTDVVQYTYNMAVNYSTIFTPSTSVETINGVCRPSTAAYENLFDFLSEAHYESTQAVVQFSGREIVCDWFSHSGHTTKHRLCAVGDTLVRYEAIGQTSITIVDFSGYFSVGPFNHDVFDISPECYENITCAPGPVEAIEVYNFHDAEDFALNNTNVADLSGDGNFFCTAVYTKAFGYFQWISQWQIEVNTTWGEYAFCNFGACYKDDTVLVGRQAAYGFGAPLAGQCTDNGLIGDWYSLPTISNCGPDQNVGDNGCTWKVIERSKTINASCLIEQGIDAVCEQEISQIPFVGAQQIFAKAFLSDDPEEGGCPPIQP
eukprot:TRINITY_DN8597_c0_g1_i1.p1 TRINITY_DN8597_c0_g1~~TRINITY_DN8597_c0_g1_i1.p1  ORF type:complete len:410 (+),score=71.22 TRINITY_DN8597_c0_g1_i1:42-1232(+)